MDRLFDEFFSDAGLLTGCGTDYALAVGAFNPRVDVSETDKEIKVSAELPGIDEKNVSVELEDEALTIKGERTEEKEESEAEWYQREQTYGSFCRVIPLPSQVDGKKAKARFRKGVLTVTVPKLHEEHDRRQTIAIESD